MRTSEECIQWCHEHDATVHFIKPRHVQLKLPAQIGIIAYDLDGAITCAEEVIAEQEEKEERKRRRQARR